jgi:hypothetical protein
LLWRPFGLEKTSAGNSIKLIVFNDVVFFLVEGLEKHAGQISKDNLYSSLKKIP